MAEVGCADPCFEGHGRSWKILKSGKLDKCRDMLYVEVFFDNDVIVKDKSVARISWFGVSRSSTFMASHKFASKDGGRFRKRN